MQAARELADVMESLSLPADLLPHRAARVPVVENPRLSRALGRAFCSSLKVDPSRDRIELQPWILASPLAAEIVAHEAAHIVCGAGVGHAPLWRLWCLRLGGTGEQTVAYARVAKYLPARTQSRVVAHCDRCGIEIERTRALPASKTYLHKGCGGVIIPRRG